MKSDYSGILSNSSLALMLAKAKLKAGIEGNRSATLEFRAEVTDSRLLEGLPEPFAACYAVMLDAGGATYTEIPHQTAALNLRFASLPGMRGENKFEVEAVELSAFRLEKDEKTAKIYLLFSFETRLSEAMMLWLYRSFGCSVFWTTEEAQGRLMPLEKEPGKPGQRAN